MERIAAKQNVINKPAKEEETRLRWMTQQR